MATVEQLVALYADLLATSRRTVATTARLLGREGLLPAGRHARAKPLGTGDAATLLFALLGMGRHGTPSSDGVHSYAALPCRAIARGAGLAVTEPIARPFGVAALELARRPEELAALESPIYALSLAIWDAANATPGWPVL